MDIYIYNYRIYIYCSWDTKHWNLVMYLTVIVKHHGFKSIAPHVGPNDPWSLVCSSSSCSTPLVIMIPLLLNNKLKNVWNLLELGHQHLWNLTDLSSLVLLFHVPLFFLKLLKGSKLADFSGRQGIYQFRQFQDSTIFMLWGEYRWILLLLWGYGYMKKNRFNVTKLVVFSVQLPQKAEVVSLAPGVSASWFHRVLQLLP